MSTADNVNKPISNTFHLQLLNLCEKSEEIYHYRQKERYLHCTMSAMTRDFRLHGLIQMTPF